MSKPIFAVVLTTALAAGNAAAQDGEGAALFRTHCAACHGTDGEGGGPVASAMSIAVPNLRSIAQRNRGTFDRDRVAAFVDGRESRAAHGSRTMPVWGDFLEAADASNAEESVRERIRALVAFIETLQYR